MDFFVSIIDKNFSFCDTLMSLFNFLLLVL
jgi:hypothetical protein